NLLVFIVAIVFVIVLIDWVLDRFLKPLEGLQRSAAALAEGDLSARPQMRFFTTEFHSLFNSFSRMAERIESSWKRQQELLIEASVARGELQATFDAMTDCVIITDSEDRVLRANSSYYRLKGAEPEQIEGRSLAEIAHPYDDWRDCKVCLARREGRNIVALKKPSENALQKYLEVRVDPIYSASGERLGAVQILRDLTEEHETRIEAEKASALLRNLVEAAYDAVTATTLDGCFLWANKRAIDLFMPDSDRLEGESLFDRVHPDDLARVRERFEMGAKGQAQSYEARLVSDNRLTRQVLITSSPVYAGDSIAAVLSVIRDVTEERRAIEQAVRDDKLRAIGQLATGIAHNFNNSLTAVLGYTQLAISKAADPDMLRHLQTVEKAAMDAAKMVQRIQNFARQRRDEPSEPCEINPILRDALDLTRSRWRDDARAASIEYEIIFKPDVNPVVLCDQAALREVFVNLIINALDAMPGGGRLTIRTEIEGDMALASFIDTGSGITEEVRKRLFEPFYTTKGVKGYGMGLAVTYGIVERHGGEITVASEPGKGAAFTIKLPLFHELAKPDMDLSEPAGAKPSRVLVADDEAPLRALVTDVMRARGHEVTTAEDGMAALKALEEGRFDLLITDLSMPGIDGWTLVRKVRSLWPATRILIMTGYGGLAEMAIPGFDAALVDDFVSKPFDLGEIDAKANALLLKKE
ncbi:MAG TPA: ATP-binding protein, partial [Blastocatellia bacterium]|nr:ATP-binding protein [Blastocatellia bacterium]